MWSASQSGEAEKKTLGYLFSHYFTTTEQLASEICGTFLLLLISPAHSL